MTCADAWGHGDVQAWAATAGHDLGVCSYCSQGQCYYQRPSGCLWSGLPPYAGPNFTYRGPQETWPHPSLALW